MGEKGITTNFTVCIIKLRRIRRKNMKHVWEIRKNLQILVETPREETTWKDIGGDGRIY